MLCVNAPRKPMARIHMLISLVLVIICTVLAFTPLMKIVVTQETQDQIENLVEYVLEKVKDDSEDSATVKARIRSIIDSMELDEASVDISLGKIAATTKPLTEASEVLAEFITNAMDASKSSDHGEEYEDKMQESLKKFQKIFLNEDMTAINPEVRDLVVVMAAIVGPMLPSGEDIESGMSEDDIPSMLANAIPSIIGLLVALFLSLLIPIIYAILALVAIITTLRHLKESDIGAAKLAKRMPKSIVHPLVIMLVPCLSATIQTTTSTLLLAIFALAGTLVNLIFTRLHSWEKQDIAYANVVQATTLVSIGGYIFLFLNILKMGVFKSFIGKMISTFANSGSSVDTTAVATDAGMIFIAVLFALLSTKYLAKVLRRESLACTPKNKGGAQACHLVNALFIFLVTILPMMVLGSKTKLLTVTLEQEYALFYGFIATGIMVLSEIVLLILRKAFGKNLTPAAVADVLSGVSLGPDKATAEEAPAEESAAEASAEEPAEEPGEEPGEEPAEEATEEVAAPAEDPAPAEEVKADDEDSDGPKD